MPAVNEGGESEEKDKSGKKRKRSGSGRKSGGPCTAEFDYLGWSAWGSYRRSVTGAAARRALKAAAAAAAAAAAGGGGGGGGGGGKKKLESSGRRLTGVSISPFPSPSSNSPSSSSGNEDTTTTATSIDSSDWEKSAEDKDKAAAAARLQDFATWHLISVPNPETTSPPSSQSSSSSSSPPSGITNPKEALAWHHVPERETRTIARAKEKMYVERTHNCWSHCDYPSECRQTVIAACEEGRAKIDRKGKKLVWVDDREKDAIEARRRKERERERENLKRTLGARRSRAGQEERERRLGQRSAGRKGRHGNGSGSASGSANVGKKKWEWGLEPVAECVEEEDVQMVDAPNDKEGDLSSSSASSSSTLSASGSSHFSSSDSSSSEDEALPKLDWKDSTMTATSTTQGTHEGPDTDNTGNLTIAMLEPFSRADGCSSRQECYITVAADDKTIDPAKLLKSNNDPDTAIPASPVSPLAGGCLPLGNSNMSTYESFTSLIDFGPMELDEMAM